MGGGTRVVQAAPPPPPPPQPTAAQSAREFAEVYPQILDTYISSLPRQISAEAGAIQQYAPELSRLSRDISAELYPETSSLQEQLAGIARQRINEPVPSSIQSEYLDQLNAGLGYNVQSPIAADYRSRGLLNLQEQWRRYYTDLALTSSGRLPLAQAVSPSISQGGAFGFSPNTVFNANAQNFNTLANYRASTFANTPYQTAGGRFGGAATGILGGAATGAAIGSVVPGLGTAIGAGVGGLLGGVGGAF